MLRYKKLIVLLICIMFFNPAISSSAEVNHATATLVPTPSPTLISVEVNEYSSSEDIKTAQELLVIVGVLDPSHVNGVYGDATSEAVSEFQRWINELRGEETLNVSGNIDVLTRRYLEYCVDNNRVYNPPAQFAPYAETDKEITFQGISWDTPAAAYIYTVKSIMGYKNPVPNSSEYSIQNLLGYNPNTLDSFTEKRCGYRILLTQEISFHNYPVKFVAGYSVYDVADGQIDQSLFTGHIVQMQLYLDTNQITDSTAAYDDLAEYFTESYGQCDQSRVKQDQNYLSKSASWISENSYVMLVYSGSTSDSLYIIYGLTDVQPLIQRIREVQPDPPTNEMLWSDKPASDTIRHFEDVSIEVFNASIREYNDESYIIFHYDWLNNSGEESLFIFEFNETVFQDGVELERCYSSFGNVNLDNIYEVIMPEQSSEVYTAFKLQNTRSKVNVTIEPSINPNNEKPLTFSIELIKNLE